MVVRDLLPVDLIILQSTSFCNIDCLYCDLSREGRRTKTMMSLDLVERFFLQLIESGRAHCELTIVWHAGEPLTLPIAYYESAIALITGLFKAHTPGCVSVRFKIQTNAVLIDEDWCAFFLRHRDRLDIGVSCDGPADMHDAFRRTRAGRATHANTLRGMDLLARHGIQYKVIAVVTAKALAAPEAFLDFFAGRREELSAFHFNIVAQADSERADLAYAAVDRDLYYGFYRRLIVLCEDARRRGVPFEITNFTHALARIAGHPRAGAMSWSEESSAPLKSITLDAQGHVSTFYAGVGRDTLEHHYGDGQGMALGNIWTTSFEQMVRSEKLQRIMADFRISARACGSLCPYHAICPGGYEVTKQLTLGTFDAAETTECLVQVKALTDALLDDIEERLEAEQPDGQRPDPASPQRQTLEMVDHAR